MSTARLTALAVNTPEMKRLWVGEGGRERKREMGSAQEVKQSSESSERNTSALHRNVLEPS